MRSTLTLEDDIAVQIERLRKSRDAAPKDIVNKALAVLDEEVDRGKLGQQDGVTRRKQDHRRGGRFVRGFAKTASAPHKSGRPPQQSATRNPISPRTPSRSSA